MGTPTLAVSVCNDDDMSDGLPEFAQRGDPNATAVEVDGPYEINHVLVNGYRVPRLTLDSPDPDPDGNLWLGYDHRFAVAVPIEHFTPTVAFIANIIAVEQGYACWPRTPDEHAGTPLPPFGGQVVGVDIIGREDPPT
jgi:hypothetical protein